MLGQIKLKITSGENELLLLKYVCKMCAPIVHNNPNHVVKKKGC